MKSADYGQMNKNAAKGMTLVEMVVSFALLSLFVSAAAVVIFNVTNLYYHVRGENYARQVADVVVEKVISEISGAKYNKNFTTANPKIYTSSSAVEEITGEGCVNSAIELYNRTDTKVLIYANSGILRIYYYEITDTRPGYEDNNRKATFWNYDRNVYNNFTIEKMDFAQACDSRNVSLANEYEIGEVPDTSAYDQNVVAVYMRMKSPKYGSFTICRYVRLYNAPADDCTITLIN